jgi:hypothetical protein
VSKNIQKSETMFPEREYSEESKNAKSPPEANAPEGGRG